MSSSASPPYHTACVWKITGSALRECSNFKQACLPLPLFIKASPPAFHFFSALSSYLSWECDCFLNASAILYVPSRSRLGRITHRHMRAYVCIQMLKYRASILKFCHVMLTTSKAYTSLVAPSVLPSPLQSRLPSFMHLTNPLLTLYLIQPIL